MSDASRAHILTDLDFSRRFSSVSVSIGAGYLSHHNEGQDRPELVAGMPKVEDHQYSPPVDEGVICHDKYKSTNIKSLGAKPYSGDPEVHTWFWYSTHRSERFNKLRSYKLRLVPVAYTIAPIERTRSAHSSRHLESSASI